MRGAVALLGGMLVLLGVGWIGYMIGASSTVAMAAAPVAYPVYGWGFGFPFFPLFGLFFFILFVALIFGVMRRAAWGGGYRGGPGRGYRGGWGPRSQGDWDHRSVPPMADEMLQGWHRRAHGEPDQSPESPGNDQK